MNDLAPLTENIQINPQIIQYTALSKIKATERTRPLRGRNQAYLVMGEDGKYCVQKLHGSEEIFNEALGTRLSEALDLAFPAWTELTDDHEPCFSAEAPGKGSPSSSFGSSLVTGELLEYLPGGWFQNVVDRSDSAPLSESAAISSCRSRHYLHAYVREIVQFAVQATLQLATR